MPIFEMGSITLSPFFLLVYTSSLLLQPLTYCTRISISSLSSLPPLFLPHTPLQQSCALKLSVWKGMRERERENGKWRRGERECEGISRNICAAKHCQIHTRWLVGSPIAVVGVGWGGERFGVGFLDSLRKRSKSSVAPRELSYV